METLRELHLVRAVPAAGVVQFRAGTTDDDHAEAAGLGIMDVLFSRFGTWYEIDSFWEGQFLERTEKGAFAKTISDHHNAKNAGARVKVMYNHGHDLHIGDKLLGQVDTLSEGDDGPLGSVELFDTSYNRDLLPGLRAGVYGSSFMFRVLREEWTDEPGKSDWNPDGIPERLVKEVRLFEFGPVTWPANPDATAGMRAAPVVSMTDAYYARMAEHDPERVASLRTRALELRTPSPDAAPTGTSDVGAAPAAPAAPTPTPGHPDGHLTHGQRRAVLYPFLNNPKGDRAA